MGRMLALFDSIVTLASLSILPFPLSYRCGIYPNSTYAIYRILSSATFRRTQRDSLILQEGDLS